LATTSSARSGQGGVIQINALPIAVVDDPGNGRTAGIAELLMRYKDAVLTRRCAPRRRPRTSGSAQIPEPARDNGRFRAAH